MSIIDDLNEAQQEAVTHKDGPCLVLAGAGSGKTRVLTKRVANLVDQGVSPHEIMAITFTNKAAQEMKERVMSQIPNFNGQWIRTFHSACYMILRMEIEQLGYRRDFTILDEGEQRAVIKECLAELKASDLKPESIGFIIKQAKNSLENPEKYFDSLRAAPRMQEIYSKVYRLYRARLKELNALDYEDLIGLTVQLFEEFPEVLKSYQDRFQYLMVDEYQDTNYAQFVWANLLADTHHNIFVVGDPDQSIYSWRGAEPYNIDRFIKKYHDTKIVKLEKNYRSTRYILDAANAVIKNNSGRPDKNLYTDNTEGEKLVQFCAADHKQEAEFVAQVIKQLVSSKEYKYHEFAVFYRTHAQSRNFEESFNRGFVPYRIVGAVRFYQRKEIKDILAILKLAANPSDRISFRRIINIPRRGVGDATIKKLEQLSTDLNISILEVLAELSSIKGMGGQVKSSLQDFYGMMKFLQELAPNTSLHNLVTEAINLSGYIDELKRTDPLDAEERIENIQEFQTVLIEFEKENKKDLVDFLGEIALLQEADDTDYSDAVLMMTYHSAKGLEFPAVFMTGMEEGVFPSYRAETQEEMEEERRLCYVGLTRARQRLFLSRAVYRMLYGSERANMCSRFLKEIPEEFFTQFTKTGNRIEFSKTETTDKIVNLNKGDVVEHRKFGRGMVISIEASDIAIIDFETYGLKTLNTDIAPLVKIG
ncbi:MAG: ATP-dependent helicase [Acidobacteriota bacterium]